MLQRQGHLVSLFRHAAARFGAECSILVEEAAGLQARMEASVPGLAKDLIAAGQPVSSFHSRNLRGGEISVAEAEQAPGEPGLIESVVKSPIPA